MEKILARYTDVLITINAEDFENTKRLGITSPDIYRINGVGVNTDRFKPVNREVKNQIRNELGYSENAFILIYAAEFINDKNHRFIIKILPGLIHHIPELKIIFAGIGRCKEAMMSYVEKEGLSEYIDFRVTCPIWESGWR